MVHPPFGLMMRLARIIGRVRLATGGAAKGGMMKGDRRSEKKERKVEMRNKKRVD